MKERNALCVGFYKFQIFINVIVLFDNKYLYLFYNKNYKIFDFI